MCAVLGVSLLVLIVPGLFAIHPENYRPFVTHGMRGFLAALPPIFFAYAGFEALAQTAGEVRDSTKRLPVIFVKGITATMIIYLLMSVVAFGVLPASRLRVSGAPMADAAAQYLPFSAAMIVTIGAIMAITTSLNATMLVPSRVAIMLADDRLAPRWIGRVSAKTGTPVIGLCVTLAAALILLLSGEVSLALNIAVFALVLLYFLHSIALLVLPRRNPALFAQVTVNVPLWLQRAMAVLSIAFMAALLTQMDLPTIKLIAFWAALGVLLYASGRIAHRRAAGGIEHAEES
jgi:amino acid transporter